MTSGGDDDRHPEKVGFPLSLLRDLRSGRAGAVVRVVLSLAAAALALGPALLVLGLVETTGVRVREEHVFMAFGFAGAAWCAELIAIWWGYPRWRRTIGTVLLVLTIDALIAEYESAGATEEPEALAIRKV